MSALRNAYLPAVKRRCINESGNFETMKICLQPDIYERSCDDAQRCDMTRAHFFRILIEAWIPILEHVVQQQVRGATYENAQIAAAARQSAGIDLALLDIFENRIRAYVKVRTIRGGLVTVNALLWPKACRVISMASGCYHTSAKELVGTLVEVAYDIWH